MNNHSQYGKGYSVMKSCKGWFVFSLSFILHRTFSTGWFTKFHPFCNAKKSTDNHTTFGLEIQYSETDRKRKYCISEIVNCFVNSFI